MAIILLEEVLMGLDEVKESVDQAVVILENIIEDISPDLRDDLQEVLAEQLLLPLLSRQNVLDNLLVSLAAEEEH